MRITNEQKKQLSDIFQELNLNILDFKTSGQFKEFKVEFKYDYFSFLINRQKQDEYYLTVFPIDNTKGYSVGGKWADTLSRFKTWAGEIHKELTTTTGWESFESENYLNTESDDLNSEFTDQEKEWTRQNIRELKRRIQTLEIPKETLNTIIEKLENLSTKVDELNKFDWKSFFIGTFASIIITFSIPPESSGMIWAMIKSVFSGLKLKG